MKKSISVFIIAAIGFVATLAYASAPNQTDINKQNVAAPVF